MCVQLHKRKCAKLSPESLLRGVDCRTWLQLCDSSESAFTSQCRRTGTMWVSSEKRWLRLRSVGPFINIHFFPPSFFHWPCVYGSTGPPLLFPSLNEFIFNDFFYSTRLKFPRSNHSVCTVTIFSWRSSLLPPGVHVAKCYIQLCLPGSVGVNKGCLLRRFGILGIWRSD